MNVLPDPPPPVLVDCPRTLWPRPWGWAEGWASVQWCPCWAECTPAVCWAGWAAGQPACSFPHPATQFENFYTLSAQNEGTRHNRGSQNRGWPPNSSITEIPCRELRELSASYQLTCPPPPSPRASVCVGLTNPPVDSIHRLSLDTQATKGGQRLRDVSLSICCIILVTNAQRKGKAGTVVTVLYL